MLERFWESKDKLVERYKALETEIASLKTKLNDVNTRKEEWFAKKEELKKQLQESIKDVKDIKIKKDTISVDIQKLKQERNAYNKTVGELISKVKLLNKEREEIYKKSSLRINPGKIKDTMELLEKKIETEIISFSKEQKLMKQIKKLKDQYNEMTEIAKVIDHLRQLSSEIEITKSKAQDLHGKIQENAKKDEIGYNDFIEKSRAINVIRQEQEDAFRKFVKLKRLYVEINNTLRIKHEEENKLKNRLDRLSKPTDAVNTKDKEIAMLKEKLKYVEEKLKNGEKLTTEDILVFQKGSDGA